MKGIFPQYDRPSEAKVTEAWQNALVVFDTNLLLNLYRYQKGTKEQLLNILHKISERIWIPYQVALEFQRNRLTVISEQNRKFTEVGSAATQSAAKLTETFHKLDLRKRHSVIDADEFIKKINTLTAEFTDELQRLKGNEQIEVNSRDTLKELIESLFDGKVGLAPMDQATIQNWNSEAEKRYKMGIPPGYNDVDKDKDAPGQFWHNGLAYERKYGDYYVWQQILAHAKSINASSLILVTDDNKDDWWLKVKSEGEKTIGPRPELIEEMASVGGVSNFLLYSSEGFLSQAKDRLAADVSEETIKDVRAVATERSEFNPDGSEFSRLVSAAEEGVANWVISQFPLVSQRRREFPYIVAKDNSDKAYGFEVKYIRSTSAVMLRLREIIHRLYYKVKENELDIGTLVLVVPEVSMIEEVERLVRRVFKEKMPPEIRLVLGINVRYKEDSFFVPHLEMLFDLNEGPIEK